MRTFSRRALRFSAALSLLLGPGLPARAAIIEALVPLQAAPATGPVAAVTTAAPILAAPASSPSLPALAGPLARSFAWAPAAAARASAAAALPTGVLEGVAAPAAATGPLSRPAAAAAARAAPRLEKAAAPAEAAALAGPAQGRPSAARPSGTTWPSALGVLQAATQRRVAHVVHALSLAVALALTACGSSDNGAPALQEITAGQEQADMQNAIVSTVGTWSNNVGDWNHDASYMVQTTQQGTLTISMSGVDGVEFNLMILDASGVAKFTSDNITAPGGLPWAQYDGPAGKYYVIVHNNNNGGLGTNGNPGLPYTINATFAADASAPDAGGGPYPITTAQIQSDISVAPTIALGPWSGVIGDNTSDNAFQLSLPQSGTLSASLAGVTGTEFDLLLLDANGHIIGRDDNLSTPGAPGWVQDAVAAGSYYLIIHNNNSGGIASTFALNTSFSAVSQPAADPITLTQIQADVASNATPLSPGVVTGAIGDPTIDVVYSLSLVKDGSVGLTLDGVAGVEFDLLVTDGSGNLLADDNNAANTGAPGAINAGLKAGVYYVIVHNNNGAGVGTSFTLNAAETVTP